MVTAPPTTADATSRPVTVSTVVIPIKLKPGLNVYHPKPIPPPEMLPLTRMVCQNFISFIYSKIVSRAEPGLFTRGFGISERVGGGDGGGGGGGT